MNRVILFLLLSFCALCQVVNAEPYRLNVTVEINKIYGVNTVDQTYKVDGYLVVKWQEPLSSASSLPPPAVYENSRVDQLVGSGVRIPTLEFINILGKREVGNKQLIVGNQRMMTYNERFLGTFQTDMNFRRFPFDSQNFVIIMEPFSLEEKQLVFTDESSAFIGSPDNQQNCAHSSDELSEWRITGCPKVQVSTHKYPHLSDNHQDADFSRLTISIAAKRSPNYYLWQFILPLSLILVASWSVFWIDEFGSRLMTSFTMMLTVVAYTFYTGSLLPHLPYTTFIGRMIIMGYVSIFTAIVIFVCLRIIGETGPRTRHIIPCCRVLFPIVSLITIAILVGVNNQL